MKRVITCCLLLIYSVAKIYAQCSNCTPVFSNCHAGGGLCNQLDTGYAGSNYNWSLNFYMPPSLTDQAVLNECSCSQVDLNSISVTGVTGLPAGINYTLSNNGAYNVQGGDTIGCVHFCGIPVLPGAYPITVNLSASVTAIGTPVGNVTETVPQSYNDTLIILPDTSGGVSSFTYGNNGSVACDSITVTLNAVLAAPSPNFTSYYWQLPNGSTSTLQSPGSFTFTNTSNVPDTFPITLITTFYNYEIEEVHINSISGRYTGGVEDTYLCWFNEPLFAPDAYITFPALGFSNSDGSLSFTCSAVDFNNLDLLIPLGTQTIDMGMYSLHILEPPDDSIGSYDLTVEIGLQDFSNGNADGWVLIDTTTGLIDAQTLYVIVNPPAATPVVTASADTFCSSDSVRLSVRPLSYLYQWYNDTALLINETDSAFYVSQSGEYRVKITNPNTGCTALSPFTTITGEETPPGPVSIYHVGSQLYVNPFSGGLAVKWFYNGVPVSTTGAVISYQGTGTYTAEVYNPAYPLCSVSASPLIISGIDDNALTDYNLNILPNPNNGNFKIQFYAGETQDINLNIRNILGQLVYSKSMENFSGKFEGEISLEGLDKGIYIVAIESSAGNEYRKIVVQ